MLAWGGAGLQVLKRSDLELFVGSMGWLLPSVWQAKNESKKKRLKFEALKWLHRQGSNLRPSG